MKKRSLQTTILLVCAISTAIVWSMTLVFYVYSVSHIGKGLADSYQQTAEAITATVDRTIERHEKRIVKEIAKNKAAQVGEVMQKLETALELVTISFRKATTSQSRRVPSLKEYVQFKDDEIIKGSLVRPNKYLVDISLQYSDFILHNRMLRNFYSQIYWSLNRDFQEIYKLYPHILWIYAGFERDGSFINYPGTSSEPENYDPRTRDWYREAVQMNKVGWTNPYYETGQNSLVVSAVRPMFDSNKGLVAVLAIDLLLNEVIEDVLAESDLRYPFEYILADNDGNVIARRGYNFVSGHWSQLAQNDSLQDLFQDNYSSLLSKEIGEIVYNGSPTYVYSADVGIQGWKLVSLVDKNSVISSWSPTIEYIQSLSQEYEGYVGSVVDKYRYVVIGHMVALFILLVVIYLILRFNVTNPVLHLQSMIRDIGSGKKIVRDHRHDKQLEYCAIADALQLMQSDIGKLQNEVHQKRVSARIGEITSQIAHDLRSPLSVIGSFVDFVDKQGCLRGKDELEFIVATKRSVGRLRNMATELLDAPRAVSVNPLVQNVYVCMCNVSDEVSCVAADQKVKIDISTDEKFYAKLDFDKIHRVFVNMLVNAVEASRKNGLVKVFVERDADSLIVVVRDWGGGIPSDLIDSIFDSYFTSGKKNGTGLGLAYCKQVVEAHGGTIHVASEVGKGTTFTIRIPNCVVEGPGLQSAAVGATGVQLPSAALSDGRIVPMKTAPAPSPERSLNIIIADDDSDMLDDLARKAKARGATIAHQASAVEEIMADDKIDFSRIQAAIVDFEYKGSRMNGIDLIRYLKSMGVKDVHLCTGHFDDPDIRRQAREAGAASILKKPLDEDELAAIL